jgi:RimJ/RimL family protein N-acetyltransferase
MTKECTVFALHTARLLLRDFVEDDAAAVYALSQEPTVTRYQTWLRLASPADARRWVQNAMYHNQLQPRQAYNLAIVHGQQVIVGLGGDGLPILFSVITILGMPCFPLLGAKEL